jgi:hypothetical protein
MMKRSSSDLPRQARDYPHSKTQEKTAQFKLKRCVVSVSSDNFNMAGADVLPSLFLCSFSIGSFVAHQRFVSH